MESKLDIGNEAMKQITFGAVTGFEKHQKVTRRAQSGRDESSGTVVSFAGVDRTALPQGRQWSPAEGLGDHAKDVPAPALVQAVRPGGRRSPL